MASKHIHALIHRGDRAGIEMLADRADVSFEEARGLMIEMFGSFLAANTDVLANGVVLSQLYR